MLTLVLFLEDDLLQHLASDVFARPRVVNFEIDALLHQVAKLLECDVAGGIRVVEAPIGIFLDDNGLGRTRFLVAQAVFP